MPYQRNVGGGRVGGFLGGWNWLWLFLMLATLESAELGRAAVFTWSGGSGSSGNWSDSANWGFAGIPTNGDILIFPASTPRLININDITNLTLNQIRFVGASGGYNLSGNAFTLTNGIEATNTTVLNVIKNNIALAVIDSPLNIGPGIVLLGGTISGSVGVTKTGSGVLTYQSPGDNLYTGVTRVNAGTLQLNVGGFHAFEGPLIVGDGSGAGSPVVRWLRTSEIGTTNFVTVNLNGLLDLNGGSDTIGPLTIQGATVQTVTGTLTMDADVTVLGSAVIPIISGNLHFNGGMHIFNISQGTAMYDFELAANVSDAGGGFLFTNPAPMRPFARIYGTNSFTGPVIIDNLTLSVEAPTALGQTNSTTTVDSNGTLWLYSTGITNKALTLAGGVNSPTNLVGQYTTTWVGPITLNGPISIDSYPASPSALELVGPITGTGGITKIDVGTLRFSGPNTNTYSGTTTVLDGVLELNKLGGAPNIAVPGSLTLSNGTTARLLQSFQLYAPPRSLALTTTMYPNSVFDLNGNDEWLAQLSLRGAQIACNGGELFLSGDVTVISDTNANSSIVNGYLDLYPWNSSTHNSITNIGHNFSPDLRLSANLLSSGTNTLIKEGAGEVDLAGTNNSYTGATIVNGGDLWVDYTNGLGNTNLPATVNNGASLFLNNNAAIGLKPLILNGAGYAFGALTAFGNNSWAGDITLATSAAIGSFSAGNNLTLSGAIDGPGGLTKNGAGTLTLTGSTPNTYAGLTTASTGTIVLNKPIGVPAVPGNVVIATGSTVRLANNQQTATTADVLVNGDGLFDFSTFYTYLDTLRGTGAVNFGALGWIELGFNNGSSEFDGIFTGVGYSPGWTVGKTGTGTFTTTGSNTYTAGVTHVLQGKMVINGSQSQIPVIVDSGATLGGSGTVGTIAANGIISPGNSPGILTSSNVTFASSGNFIVELTGPNPGVGGYDQLNARGTNSLSNATLNVLPAFTTPVAIGQQFVILRNALSIPITGTFNGLAEGATVSANNYTFRISYVGGSGHDVVLTLIGIPGTVASSTVTSGNASGAIDPNECNYLNVVVSNQTASPMTGVSATLSSATPNVAVTQPFSSYPDVPASGTGTNAAAFQISTSTNFACGTPVNLQLSVNSSLGSFTMNLALASGETSVSPNRYDNSTPTSIPDVGSIDSTNTVAGFVGPLAKVAVAMYVTHTLDSDLTNISLIAPDGTTVLLSSANGGGGQNYGSNCSPDASRTTFDDTAGISITNGAAPFVGSFRPQSRLSALIGNATPNGNWRLHIADGFGGSLGTLRCWSLFLYPTVCAPGGGICALCPSVTIFGATGPASPTQPGYVNYNGIPSSCGAPKVCPGTVAVGSYPSDNYTFVNGPSDACITVTVEDESPTVAMLATVYSGSYDVTNANKCLNYLADGGNVLSSSNPSQVFSFNVASNATFVVNIIANSSATAPYQLTVSGGDCRPVLNITRVATNNVQLDWTTAAAGFGLQRTNPLVGVGATWQPVTNIPIVVNSRFRVTNNAAIGNQFFRLYKP
jgi:autotransporter-associated beta strand protein